jgi:hypothetical protein
MLLESEQEDDGQEEEMEEARIARDIIFKLFGIFIEEAKD